MVKILWVDDEVELLKPHVLFLKAKGYEVATCNNGYDAIDMAADAIGLWGITAQDMGKVVPAPSSALPACNDGELATFALVDFDAYRRANDMRTIRKNVTLPCYLNDLAEKAGLNFSRILQDALKEKLQVN